jgi:hypothetical protein
MSETPHCLTAGMDARCCRDVKFCRQDSKLAHCFLTILMTQVTESKRLGPGFNTVGESRARTAIDVLGNLVILHLREQPCI